VIRKVWIVEAIRLVRTVEGAYAAGSTNAAT
jgi:hypothetical protein